MRRCNCITAYDPDSPGPADVSGTERCRSPSALQDLAALSQGNLSRARLHRLVRHIAECRVCVVTLASLVSDARAVRPPGDQSPALRLVPDSER